MPIAIIHSDDQTYGTLNSAQRGTIAETIHKSISAILNEPLLGVAARWAPPFETDSAVNELEFTVDIEYSQRIRKKVRKMLGLAVIGVFVLSPDIAVGVMIGVWIKTPDGYFWYDGTKPGMPEDNQQAESSPNRTIYAFGGLP